MYWILNEASVFLHDLCTQHTVKEMLAVTKQRFNFITSGADAVFDPADIAPFFALHFLQIPLQLVHIILAGTPWSKVDWCSGKVVCLNGD